ncbi:MAG: DMT family transporter [Candidatus Eisenbacteria bacterium]
MHRNNTEGLGSTVGARPGRVKGFAGSPDGLSNTRGFLFALGGTVVVSTNFVTAKYGLKGFNPETFSLVWTAAAAVYSLLIVLGSGQLRQLALPGTCARDVALLGVATGAGMILGWAGLARLDPSFSSFLWRFHPLLVIVLSVLILRERLTAKELAPAAIMILGGCISTIGRWNIVGTGVVLTLLSCCAVAVQVTIAKSRVQEMHPNVLVFYRVASGSVVILLWCLLVGDIRFDVEARYWHVTLLGAFLGPCLSYLLTFRSYRHWDLSRSSMVTTAQPLFVIPFAYLAFGTLPTGRELIGGFIILAGAFWLAWKHVFRRWSVGF